MTTRHIKLEPLHDPDEPEILEFPLIEGHASTIKEEHQISLKIEEIHQISNSLTPKTEFFLLSPSEGEVEDDDILEGEPRNAVARRLKRNRDLRAADAIIGPIHVPYEYRPRPPKKRVNTNNKSTWAKQVELVEMEMMLPIFCPVEIAKPPPPGPPGPTRRCSICFKRTDTTTIIKGTPNQLVLITGQILNGKKSISQANIFLSDPENSICQIHLKESLSEIFRILGVKHLGEVQSCSNPNRLMITVNSLYPSHSQYFRNFEKLKSKEAHRKTEANCWKMLPNTILILLLTLMVQSLDAFGTVEIELGGPKDPCAKYTEKGTDYMELTHVRVIEIPNEGKNNNVEIVKNIICDLDKEKSKDPLKYEFKCKGKGSGRKDTGEVVIVGVRLIKPMLSGSIEYMYSEDTMQLFHNGFMDPAKMKNEKFHHDRHLHIKSITTNGVVHDKSSFYGTNCHGLFPHTLIADHGLFMIRSKSIIGNFLTPMYYEPIEHNGVLDMTLTNH